MLLIGIDIGTTSVSGALIDQPDRRIVTTTGIEHHAGLDSADTDISIQDPERLFHAVLEVKKRLLSACHDGTTISAAGSSDTGHVAGISLTGQVHGILYIDPDGNAASPLYTWQDTRAKGRRFQDTDRIETWYEWVYSVTGYDTPPGYGFLTHLINREAGMVPENSAGMVTIIGYAGMKLTGTRRPLVDPTDAQAMGFSNLRTGNFDRTALTGLGLSDVFIPEVVACGTLLGHTGDGIPVFAGAGDNQAGFIGAVANPDEEGLINIGTSAQFSAFMEEIPAADSEDSPSAGNLEIRPYPGGGFLLTGASITGGSSYTVLEHLYRNVCRLFAGTDPGPLMDRLFNSPELTPEAGSPSTLRVGTQFRGTRRNPSLRGWITGIDTGNFTHEQLMVAFTHGIVDEIAAYITVAREAYGKHFQTFIGVGNGVNKNRLLRSTLEEKLGVPLLLPEYHEAAAVGAAIIAGTGAGLYRDFRDPTRPIAYFSAERGNE